MISQLFEDATVPTKVYEEFVKKWGQLEVPAWIKVETLSNNLKEEAQRIKLGFGEAQAIVLAKHKECLLALDDRKAREEAKGDWTLSEALESSGSPTSIVP